MNKKTKKVAVAPRILPQKYNLVDILLGALATPLIFFMSFFRDEG